jgi:hypothetical protein
LGLYEKKLLLLIGGQPDFISATNKQKSSRICFIIHCFNSYQVVAQNQVQVRDLNHPGGDPNQPKVATWVKERKFYESEIKKKNQKDDPL